MPEPRPAAWHPGDVVGGNSTSAKHLHFKARSRRRPGLRSVALLLTALALVAAAAAARVATESIPPLKVQRTFPASVTIPGAAPTIVWPAHGEAALSVAGMGSIGSAGPSDPVPVASLAKVMTAYVLLLDHPTETGQGGVNITMSPTDVAIYHTAAAQQQSVVPVVEGESLSEPQILQALLVASGNNIATTVANFDAGSTTAFVAKMNSTAKSLGMNHTTYTDPSGLASTTVSTASDQLVLAAKAMNLPAFAAVVAMPTANLPVAGTVTNFNKSVGTGGYIGIKTGSTTTAGGCLMFANRLDIAGKQTTILGVVLGQGVGQSGTSALTDAALGAANALVGSVRASISTRTVIPAGTLVATVTNASGTRVGARTSAAITVNGFGGQTLPVDVALRRLGSSLSPGQPVASVSVAGGDQTVSAKAAGTLRSPSWTWRLSHIF